MMLPAEKSMTYEDFLKLDNENENLEFINGKVYLLSAPSVLHQTIVTNLSTEFGIYFRNNKCRHFVAPFDVVFIGEQEKHRAQPDLTVICDKEGLNENNYEGVPELVVEVLSSSTAAKDYIEKMNLYMRFGVKEYWIISPKNRTVEAFYLSSENIYSEPTVYFENGIISSKVFPDLEIKLEGIFRI